MSEQLFYTPGDPEIKESYQKEFEDEREALKSAFQEIWEDSREIVSYSASASAEPKAFLIKVDASAGAITLTMPEPSSIPLGKKYVIKKLDSANDLTIGLQAGSAAKIEGSSTYSILAAAGKKGIILMSDGVDYHLIAQS